MEGSSSTTSSGKGGNGEVLGGSEDLADKEESEGLESSEYRRIWERILHCRHVAARTEGRFDKRRDLETAGETIGSTKSLGMTLVKGFMASPDSHGA